MELDEFIKSTLVSIKKGINNANSELAKMRRRHWEQIFLLSLVWSLIKEI